MTDQEGRAHPFHLRFRQGRLFAAEVRAEQTIDAPIAWVWSILSDLENYEAWNSFTPSARATLKTGEPVHLHVKMPGRKPLNRVEWINLVEPERTICWGMHIGHRALLTANRWQILAPLGESKTRYITTDKFSGLLTPLVLALYGEPMRLGFQAMADNLKVKAEETHEGD